MISNVSVSTGTLMAAVIGITVLILLTILVLRIVFKNKSTSGLTKKYAGKSWKSPLEARTKYPDVDVFRARGQIMGLSLAASLLLTIAAMNWTTYEEEVYIPDDALALDEEIEVEPPRSQHDLPPPPPPPPPPKIEEVPDEVVLEEDEDLFVDMSIEAESAVAAPTETASTDDAPPPPPPPPPMKEPEIEEIFKVVEQMPRFPGCEDMAGTNEEKKACADQKLLEFIYSNIRYPEIARENGVEGTVVVSFVVDSDGNVNDVTILRDIGAGCGQEAARVIERMNDMPEKWIPGRQRGRSVSVLYNLPVKFKLEHL